MNKKIVYLFVLILWGITTPGYAVDIKGLYEIEMPVINQTKAERKEAMRSGLLELLIKISGSSEIPFTPGIPDILDKARSYVQQFRYRGWPADRPVPEGEKPPTRILWIRYDKQAINKLLQEQGFPIWGRSRPAVLIWMAVEDDQERYLLGTDNNVPMRKMFELEAKRRGLPILFPLLDLQDQVNLRVLDVWADFQEEIIQASMRYQTKAILSGRLFRDSYDGWIAKWTLYEGSDISSWESSGPKQEYVFGDAVNGVASSLAARYAQVVDDATKDAFYISVTNIKNLSDYSRVTKYLESLASVAHASAVQFDAAHAIIRLDIKGAEEGIVRAIDLGKVLVAEQNNQDSLVEPDQQGNITGRAYRLLQ